ncbi:hypothetical protein [Halovivax cerinus]|uniref:Ig-like domain-containing protein n=1 Tax=Halovivax cerinus TaxID=1487865 RepID=A0ABD5NRE4_9EURY|nr:hypothetical protein [Halovivax cerinus]
MTDRDSTQPPGIDSDGRADSDDRSDSADDERGQDERRPARDEPPATDTDQSVDGDDGSADRDADGDVERRTYLQAIGAAGAAGAIGAGAGLSGLGSQPVSAQADPNGSVLATFCGTFSGGPQVQQCLSCVEAACPGEEVTPVYPIVTGLTGTCFTPNSIPAGADYVTLKAGTNCYVAPVNGNTTFCLPPGAPDISNATFYSCGGDQPQPAVVDYTVTCEEIVVTTANIDTGTTLTAQVTFLDGEGNETTETFQATVQNNTATFALPGNLNPTNLVLLLDDLVLDDQPVVAEDAPCTPEPPVFDGVDVTCDAITVSTTNVPEGETLSITVSFANGVVETYNVPVDADGVAVVPLPGDVDPSHLTVVYDGETLFDMEVQATDAPCAEPPTPPTPDPRLDSIEVTCEAVRIVTADIPDGDVLTVTVSLADGTSVMEDLAIDADGVATLGLPGDVDPTHLTIVYDGETLFDMEVQATDAPCAEPTPPEPPEPPTPKPPKKEIRKKMMRHKRAYEKYKKMLEKSD